MTLTFVQAVAVAVAGATALLQAQHSLSRGHVDVGIACENGAWDLHVHDEETDTEYEPDQVVLRVKREAQIQVPSRFEFLGEPGSTVWVLPEIENHDLLFLGLGAEEIATGAFVDNQVILTLTSVDGPGDFFLYHTDSFGDPVVSMNSANEIDPSDQRIVLPGSHAHVNWAFSKAGTYRIGLQASGSLVSGGNTRSEVVDYIFEVEPVAFLTNQHIDILVQYVPDAENALEISVRDSTADLNYPGNEVVIRSDASAELTLPPGTPFGAGGDSIWILPQDRNPERPNLPDLGFSADEVPGGMYESPLRYQLVSVEGPDEFFLWQASGSGLDIQMNSRDGIDENDHTELEAGGHAHYNWGFTEPGRYCVTLQAQGRRVSMATDDMSVETPITFYIEPLPTEPNFQVWQRKHWPTCVPDTIKGPNADPDRDLIVNGMEYALGLNPLVPSREGLPEFVWVTEADQRYGALQYTRMTSASDLDYSPQVIAHFGNYGWERLTEVVEVVDHGESETVTVRDSVAALSASMRFYRLMVSFNKP